MPWWQRCMARTLAMGPIPNHVAFILDGNRRWARERNLPISEGHVTGAHTVMYLSNFMEALGIREITLYTFSIENFKRDQAEVDQLMGLVHEAVEEYRKWMPNLLFRLVGNLALLPQDIQDVIVEMLEQTKDNTGMIVNLAIAYSCRDDVTQGIVRLLKDKEAIISVQTLEEQMYTRPLSEVDILVRTSGETRLSDFLMWETPHAYLCFVEKNWPSLTYWDFSKCILKYQHLVNKKAVRGTEN